MPGAGGLPQCECEVICWGDACQVAANTQMDSNRGEASALSEANENQGIFRP